MYAVCVLMQYGTAAAAMAVAMVLAAASHAHAEGEDAAEPVSLWIPDRMIVGEQYHGMIIAGEARPGGLLAYLSTGDDHVATVPSTASVGPYRNVYAQVQGILTSMQAQLHLIDPYARHELNLDLRIYRWNPHTRMRALTSSRSCTEKYNPVQVWV